ncbi:TPA: hypothetical protein DDW35_06815 [Candidatus Sumerlaeota bacterium]|nr:hypothetical protein [Candidatus Sumerlaeota bacterium]
MTLKQTAQLLILSTALLLAAACAQTQPPSWITAAGNGVAAPGRSVGAAARAAKDAALQEARTQIWNNLLNEKIPRHPQGLTIEQMAATQPSFSAKLRRLIGSLEPDDIRQDGDGKYTITLKIDRNAVYHLAEPYLYN